MSWSRGQNGDEDIGPYYVDTSAVYRRQFFGKSSMDETELANTIEYHMIVNSSLIDNAFFSSEISIRVRFKSLFTRPFQKR